MSTTGYPGEPAGHAHPSLDALADLQEDLLPRGEADDLTAHVAGCATCQDRQTQLAGVQGRLSGLADAGPVPDDVVARLDATLRDELARPAPGVAAATVTPMPTRS